MGRACFLRFVWNRKIRIMVYSNIFPAVFVSRPNRFIAQVLLDGQLTICHVKNTGRCRELLVPGTQVFLQRVENPNRKTAYDLISVYKGDRLINMDAAAPNRVFAEWVAAGHFWPQVSRFQAEVTHGHSRFDFYLEGGGQKAFVEVKGVTLEQEGVVLFPDAPTERGVKHLKGLQACVAEGLSAYVVFIIQMSHVAYFTPNQATHPAFGQALREAAEAGVQVLALDCDVTETSLSVRGPVPVCLPKR